jgi:hypothetical protein
VGVRGDVAHNAGASNGSLRGPALCSVQAGIGIFPARNPVVRHRRGVCELRNSALSRRMATTTNNQTNPQLKNAKNLTREAPRSPRLRLGGYAILARMIDKGRATIAGTAGEYHFDCPVDNMLFGFKGVKGDAVRSLLASGASDDEIVAWFNQNGTRKTDAEIKAWSAGVEAARPYDDPEKRDWFVGECKKVGLDPQKATLFDYLDADDKQSFRK